MKQCRTGILLLSFASILVSCASSNQSASSLPAATQTKPASANDSAIVGNIPSGSKFSKLQLGMSMGEVHEILGPPTDTKTYSTGKVWIPFYFGKDAVRMQEFYKGQGNITYTGAGVGGTHFTVYRAEYDSNASGHPPR